MADERLEALQELVRRNAIPDDRKPFVDELIKRGVIKANDQSEGFGMKALRQGLDTLTFGFNDKAASALYAAGQQFTGSPNSFSDDYNAAYERASKRQSEAAKDAAPAIVGRTAGMTAQGLATLPRQAALGSYEYAKEATRPVTNALASWAEGLPTALRYGTAYGAAEGAGHSSGTLPNQLLQVIEGAGAGAVMAPIVYTGMYGAGGLIAKNQRRREANKDAVAANVDEARAIGIDEPLGPAMAGGVQSNVARAVGAGIGGKPIGDAAARNIDQWQASMGRTLSEPVGGMEAGNLGKSVQEDLRNALIRRSKSGETIKAMPDEELHGISGPVGEGGFLTPRQAVPAIKPRDVEPIQARDVGEMPRAPEPVRAAANIERSLSAKGLQIERATAEHNVLAQASRERLSALEAVARQYNDLSKKAASLAEEHASMGGNFIRKRKEGETVNNYMARQQDIERQYNDTLAQMKKLEPDVNTYNKINLDLQSRVERIRSLHSERADMEANLNNLKAADVGRKVSYEAEVRQWNERKAQADAEAAERTAFLREQERLRTDEANRLAQEAADKRYQKDLSEGGDAFRSGRSRESYPTEFDAAYEAVQRTAPKGTFNPLGDGYSKTRTFKLLFDEAERARSTLKLDKSFSGNIFGGEKSTLDPAFKAYLRDRLGASVTERLATMAERRGPVGRPSQDATRELYIDLGRLAREAERPQYPAQPRPEDAALMRRLQGALRDDFYDNMSSRGVSPRFTTESGTYTNEGGRTTRAGMPQTDETYFMRPEHVSKLLGEPPPAPDRISRTLPTENIRGERHPTRGPLVGKQDATTGEFNRSTLMPHNQHPDKGLVPVEVWDGGNRLRVGTPITSRAPTEGEKSVAMLKNVDEGYRQYITELRKPLSKVFGDNVEPIQALDRLSKAALTGETSIINAYARVMREKADPNKGAAALLHHMSGGGKDMARFLETWREMPNVTKNALFEGREGQMLRGEIERYVRVGERLEKFVGAAKVKPFADPSRIAHIATVAAFFKSAPAVVAMVGGNAVAARVMSSPRYLRWLSEVPDRARGGFDTTMFNAHMARLGAIAEKDESGAGDALLKAVGMSRTVTVPDQGKGSALRADITSIEPMYREFSKIRMNYNENDRESDRIEDRRLEPDRRKQQKPERMSVDDAWKTMIPRSDREASNMRSILERMRRNRTRNGMIEVYEKALLAWDKQGPPGVSWDRAQDEMRKSIPIIGF